MRINLNGHIDKVLFFSKSNSFTIAALQTESSSYVKVVGTMPPGITGQNVTVTGEWYDHPKYGRQFACDSCFINLPTTSEDIFTYLASGSIKGIGEKLARRIVDTFGSDTLSILKNEPERLTSISGITQRKVNEIKENFRDDEFQQETLIQLYKYGISSLTAQKIFEQYKENSLNILRNNPYQLSKDIKGFGFKKADKIARIMGIRSEDPFRIQSGILYVLTQSMGAGDLYLLEEDLVNDCEEILKVEEEKIFSQIDILLNNNTIILENDENDNSRYYLPQCYETEFEIAKRLINLYFAPTAKFDCRNDLEKFEEEVSFKLDKLQAAAIEMSINSSVSIITGGPGTGKSTIIKAITRFFTKRGYKVALAAPTGRAAKRMAELTDYPASTIHRLLEFGGHGSKHYFERNEDKPLEEDVVIIDEMSMVDEFLMKQLLRAIKPETKLILIGDADQLPSVGPGKVLSELINSECLPVVRLNRIFRQSEGSLISSNAHRINTGCFPMVNQKSEFLLYETKSDAETVDFISTYLSGLRNFDRIYDVQILSPFKNKQAGTIKLNEVLQDVLNKASEKKTEVRFRNQTFREGDKIIQIRNNYDRYWISNGEDGYGIFNGDMGVIKGINLKEKLVKVAFFDDKESVYKFSELDEFVHAFAMTVHKSQGSEYKCVIIPVVSGSPMFLNRRLLYTAVSRGKKKVVLVGSRENLVRMINSADQFERNTALREKVQSEFNSRFVK